jgi:hypothetical protein
VFDVTDDETPTPVGLVPVEGRLLKELRLHVLNGDQVGLPLDEFSGTRGQAARANLYGHGLDRRQLGLCYLQQLVRIVRLNPIAQKPRGNGNGQLPVTAIFGLHAHKPGRVKIFPEFRPQTLGNIAPAVLQPILRRIRHGSFEPLIVICYKPDGARHGAGVVGIDRFPFAAPPNCQRQTLRLRKECFAFRRHIIWIKPAAYPLSS